MLREVQRQPQVRRPVQPVDEPVHHRARHQLEVVDPRQHLRIDEAAARHHASLMQVPHPFLILDERKLLSMGDTGALGDTGENLLKKSKGILSRR